MASFCIRNEASNTIFCITTQIYFCLIFLPSSWLFKDKMANYVLPNKYLCSLAISDFQIAKYKRCLCSFTRKKLILFFSTIKGNLVFKESTNYRMKRYWDSAQPLLFRIVLDYVEEKCMFKMNLLEVQLVWVLWRVKDEKKKKRSMSSGKK